MLDKYRLAVAYIPVLVRDRLRFVHRIPEDVSLYEGLHARGWGQADLVMWLLSDNTPYSREAVSLLANVTVLPPAVPPYPPHPYPAVVRRGDDRLVLRVGRNPRLPTTPAFQRFRAIRRGLSVSQLVARGVTRKDLRELIRAGAVTIEPEPGEGRAAS